VGCASISAPQRAVHPAPGPAQQEHREAPSSRPAHGDGNRLPVCDPALDGAQHIVELILGHLSPVTAAALSHAAGRVTRRAHEDDQM